MPESSAECKVYSAYKLGHEARQVDKRQAEGIADALLAHDDHWKGKRQRQRDWLRTKSTLFNYAMAGAIPGFMVGIAVQYFFVSGSVKGDLGIMIAELGALVGAVLGVCMMSRRRYIAARSRERSRQRRLHQELSGRN